MSLIEGWLPPTRQNYELILNLWQFGYPVVGSLQWIISWYGMGKTSVQSPLNLPGRIAWFTMEVPGFLTMLYIMRTLPPMHGIDDLPWQNRVLCALFVIHYIYRAVIYPFVQPSMSPLHIAVWSMAVGFQLLNAISLGSWLAAYGPVTQDDWSAQSSIFQFVFGIAVFYVGLAANFFHDDELREIRRAEKLRQEYVQEQQARKQGISPKAVTVEKHYQIPQAGLFRYMLFPHYFCEWVEWAGFYVAAGLSCAPARAFLLNEIFSMLPRAVRGKAWYIERFGVEKVGKKWAVIPGVW
ncbi:hypothetical protein B0I35DRAFT_351366 [Stachybotrys elegans]|uniref:3-oxo-5-alpha-steroid 4-dehydrogenase C-terminal domain-containing protein n=1 Tax=Stachybotrys elegans TaxID=80388 RepID=A0A8K0WT33_9HYPO|nr:hypothetical protein B0I35DRAFT_351366 [Stachybotrys elegans]